jgi:hypothetical protein
MGSAKKDIFLLCVRIILLTRSTLLIRPERLDQLDIPHPNVAGISKCSFADIKKHERAGSIHFLSDTSLFNLY